MFVAFVVGILGIFFILPLPKWYRKIAVSKACETLQRSSNFWEISSVDLCHNCLDLFCYLNCKRGLSEQANKNPNKLSNWQSKSYNYCPMVSWNSFSWCLISRVAGSEKKTYEYMLLFQVQVSISFAMGSSYIFSWSFICYDGCCPCFYGWGISPSHSLRMNLWVKLGAPESCSWL